MRIVFHPQRFEQNPGLTVSVSGETVTINGDDFDFSPLGEGEVLPVEAIGTDYIPAAVTRVDGVLIVPILLPHGANTYPETLFPDDIMDPDDGPITLPAFERRGARS